MQSLIKNWRFFYRIAPAVFLTFLFSTDISAASLSNWFVLEFSNESGYKNGSLGRFASDKFIDELVRTGKYEAVSSETLARAFAELDLRLPLVNENQIVRLGTALNSLTVITGTFKKSQILQDRRGKRAEVIV